jgi:pimeloyl-ACP methyl ester carboxylesterase
MLPYPGLVALAAVVVAVLCAAVLLLQSRDDATLLRWPRPPIPSSGRVTTIRHDAATMARVASKAGVPVTSLAPAFDMYYELEGSSCVQPGGSSKNLVLLSGTNGASYLYWPLLRYYQRQGYCTLNFYYRAHGRSEVSPGAYTAELYGEDAAAIVRHAFGGKGKGQQQRKVHLLGWSLGGALGYYLALEHPGLVQSLTLSGMTSCFGRTLSADGSCDDSLWARLRQPLGVGE